MATILWVEDQTHWVTKFKPLLEAEELDGRPTELHLFKFSEAARQFIASAGEDKRPDLALLDARMNGVDEGGYLVAKALLNKWGRIPIIFLSEHSGTNIERKAFEDLPVMDFISKHQHNIEEVLIWRMKAALRQASTLARAADTEPDLIESGNLKIDLATWEVYWKGIKLMNPDNPKRPLAPTPRKILRCLVERSPRPVSTAQIAEYLGSDPDSYAPATYRQHIKALRKAIDAANGGDGEFIKRCKQGEGIVALGDEGAYGWKPV